jgi:hypothetical protein
MEPVAIISFVVVALQGQESCPGYTDRKVQSQGGGTQLNCYWPI